MGHRTGCDARGPRVSRSACSALTAGGTFGSTRSRAGSTAHPAFSSQRCMAAEGETTVFASWTDIRSIQSSSRSATWSSGCPLPSRFAHSVGLRERREAHNEALRFLAANVLIKAIEVCFFSAEGVNGAGGHPPVHPNHRVGLLQRQPLLLREQRVVPGSAELVEMHNVEALGLLPQVKSEPCAWA